MSELEDLLAFQLKAAKIKYEREYRFHPTRKFRFDFAFPGARLAAEIDGGIWSGGRHVRGSGVESDCTKQNLATLAGWRLLRFTGRHVKSGEALQTILDALK